MPPTDAEAPEAPPAALPDGDELAALGRAVLAALRAEGLLPAAAAPAAAHEPAEADDDELDDAVDEPVVAATRWPPARIAKAVLLALLLLAAVRLAAPLRLSYVASGSMRPAMAEGALVVSAPTEPEGIRLGDVITFTSPTPAARRTTHRVIGVGRDGGRVVLRTKGDANAAVDGWELRPTEPVLRSVGVVPLVGTISAIVRHPVVRTGLLVLPAYAVGFLVLARVWGLPVPRRRLLAP